MSKNNKLALVDRHARDMVYESGPGASIAIDAGDWLDLRKKVDSLEAELELMKKFYELAIKERNYERVRFDRVESERDRLYRALEDVVPLVDTRWPLDVDKLHRARTALGSVKNEHPHR